MDDTRSAPSVVVGVDGSRAAIQAALWAVDEAVGRDIPLRLVYVIDHDELSGAAPDHVAFAAARTALCGAQRAVEATGRAVKIETETLTGKPVAELAHEARSAAMICVGSIGMRRACHGGGSVAAVLPQVARCPVAIIRAPRRRATKANGCSIVVEVDNGVVLRHAFEEAELRGAPLRAVATWRAEAPDDIADGSRLARARLNRRIDRWRRRYPGVTIEPTVVRGSICEYLAKNAASVEAFLTGARANGCDLGNRGALECSVLTIPPGNL